MQSEKQTEVVILLTIHTLLKFAPFCRSIASCADGLKMSSHQEGTPTTTPAATPEPSSAAAVPSSGRWLTISVPSHDARAVPRPSHTTYRIDCGEGAKTWTTYKRFSEFCKLRDQAKNLNVVPPGAPFPPWKWYWTTSSSTDPVLADERREQLDAYVKAIAQHDAAQEILRAFVDVEDGAASDASAQRGALRLDHRAAAAVAADDNDGGQASMAAASDTPPAPPARRPARSKWKRETYRSYHSSHHPHRL